MDKEQRREYQRQYYQEHKEELRSDQKEYKHQKRRELGKNISKESEEVFDSRPPTKNMFHASQLKGFSNKTIKNINSIILGRKKLIPTVPEETLPRGYFPFNPKTNTNF